MQINIVQISNGWVITITGQTQAGQQTTSTFEPTLEAVVKGLSDMVEQSKKAMEAAQQQLANGKIIEFPLRGQAPAKGE